MVYREFFSRPKEGGPRNVGRMKAFCSDCGEEVETEDVFGKGTEAYRCRQCGAQGTMTRKRRSPSFVQMGKADAPQVASVSLNLLDLLDLKLNQTHHKCPRCGSFSSADSGHCPFCNEPLS